jgi:hypothetical protein
VQCIIILVQRKIGEEIEPVAEYQAWRKGGVADIPWDEMKNYDLVPRDGTPESTRCINADERIDIQLPRSRRHVGTALIKQALRRDMTILQAIDNIELKVAPLVIPPPNVIHQQFACLTPT